MIDRRYFRYFDWVSFLLILFLAIIGLLFVFSATYKPYQPYSLFFKKQLFGLCSGLIPYFLFCLADYRLLMQWGYFLYGAVIVLLIITLIRGSIGMGGQRWIDILFFKFQPSDIAKLFFPAFITYHLYNQNDLPRYSFYDFLPIIFVLIISFLLIRKQPDLGTGLLILISGFILLWVAGLSKRFFIGIIALGIAFAPILWHSLKPYQKKRIVVFLGEGDIQKDRYQIEQSKIALGSGGLLGKGFLQGTQNKLMFLPESRTDFIFSVIGEEWGFTGILLIIITYGILFIRLLYLITTVSNFYAQLLALGLLIHCMVATIINIGMVTGLLPVVGISLPLISYGITNLWITFASFGWLNGIIIRRFYTGE